MNKAYNQGVIERFSLNELVMAHNFMNDYYEVMTFLDKKVEELLKQSSINIWEKEDILQHRTEIVKKFLFATFSNTNKEISELNLGTIIQKFLNFNRNKKFVLVSVYGRDIAVKTFTGLTEAREQMFAEIEREIINSGAAEYQDIKFTPENGSAYDEIGFSGYWAWLSLANDEPCDWAIEEIK